MCVLGVRGVCWRCVERVWWWVALGWVVGGVGCVEGVGGV